MQTDDNNSAGAENVTTTSFSVSEAAGKLEDLISDDDFGDGQGNGGGDGASQDDEPIPSYADEDPVEGDHGVDGADDGSETEDQADDQPDARPEETRLDAVVTLPDGQKLTVKELIDGNLKDADYRKKTAEVSEIRKDVVTQHRAVVEKANTLGKLVTFVDSLIASAVPPRPDAALRHRDPTAYADQLTAHEEASEALEKYRGEAKPMLDAAVQATTEQKQAHQNEQYRLLVEKDPKFGDKKNIEKFIGSAMSSLSEAGYSPKEIQEALGNDHRMVPIIEGFMNWQRYLKNRDTAKQKGQGKPTPIRDRGGRFRNGKQGISRDERDAFHKNPSEKNAARLLERFIE